MTSVNRRTLVCLFSLLGTSALAQDLPVAPFHLNAGYAQDSFFLRSDDDNFVLIPSGRLQMDFLGYQGAGNAKEPFNSFFPRRARLETFGTLMKHFDFQLGAEFTSAAAPLATDDYININYTPYANVEIGQFDAPFTMENRTSDKYTDMQERSVAVRGFAFPENKAVGGMIWGQPVAKWAYWSLGLFNGEGQNGFTHHSNSFETMGRAWVAPFGLASFKPLSNVWVGGSFLAGNVGWSNTSQLDHLSFSDTGRFIFFTPTFTAPTPAGGAALPANNVHMGAFGAQTKWALELNAPVGPVVLKSEYIHVDENTRELDTAAKSAVVRKGNLNGDAFYVRASFFVFGDPLINGLGGTQLPPHLIGDLRPNKTGDALQLVAEFDHINFDYLASDLATTASDGLVGNYGLDVLGVGANYWLTKRVRLTSNFLYNIYSGRTAHPLAGSNSYEITGRVALAL